MSDPVHIDSRSVRHDLPLLHPAQAQKEFIVNEALARLEALTQPSVLGMLADPPSDPLPGDAYIVAPDAAGIWSDARDAIAVWQGDQWLRQAPAAGTKVYRSDIMAFTLYNNGWQIADAPSAPQGGSTVDTEARTAIAELVAVLQHAGIVPSS